jgi:hypothetical protein
MDKIRAKSHRVNPRNICLCLHRKKYHSIVKNSGKQLFDVDSKITKTKQTQSNLSFLFVLV